MISLIVLSTFLLNTGFVSFASAQESKIANDQSFTEPFIAVYKSPSGDENVWFISNEFISGYDAEQVEKNHTIKSESVLTNQSEYSSLLRWDNNLESLYTVVPGIFGDFNLYLIVNSTSRELGWSRVIPKDNVTLIKPWVNQELGVRQLGEKKFYRCAHGVFADWAGCHFYHDESFLLIDKPIIATKPEPEPTKTVDTLRPTDHQPFPTNIPYNVFHAWITKKDKIEFSQYLSGTRITDLDKELLVKGIVTRSIMSLMSSQPSVLQITSGYVTSQVNNQRVLLGVGEDGALGWSTRRENSNTAYVRSINGAFSDFYQIGDVFYSCGGKLYIPDSGCEGEPLIVYMIPYPLVNQRLRQYKKKK